MEAKDAFWQLNVTYLHFNGFFSGLVHVKGALKVCSDVMLFT